MNIFDFDSLYRSKKAAQGLAGSVVRISLKPVKPGWTRVLNHVTVENLDNDYTKVRLGIHNRGEDYYLDELTSPTEDELVVEKTLIVLGDGDAFFSELTGTTTGDDLIMLAIGWSKRL